jgi:hypothetical protein
MYKIQDIIFTFENLFFYTIGVTFPYYNELDKFVNRKGNIFGLAGVRVVSCLVSADRQGS